MANNWFPHDSSAHNDQRILALRVKYGWEGYGLFWAMLEAMYETADGKLDAKAIPPLCLRFGIEPTFLKDFVDYCVELGLFEKKSNVLFSLRLVEEKEYQTSRSLMAKKSANLRWKKGKRKGMRTHSESNAIPTLPTNPPTGSFELRDDIEKQLSKMGIDNPSAYLDKLLEAIGQDYESVQKAWKEWKRGCGIESPANFWERCSYWHNRREA